VCGLSDFEAGNDVLFCGDGAGQGCDGAFHQKCYAVPTVPEGDWFCRACVCLAQPGDATAAAGYAAGHAAGAAAAPAATKAATAAAAVRAAASSDDGSGGDGDFETSAGGREAAGSRLAPVAEASAADAAAVDAADAASRRLAASVRGRDPVADGAKLRALDRAAAASDASDAEPSSSSSSSSSGGYFAGPAAEAAALDLLSGCAEFASLCAFFDRFQWPSMGHGQLALALAPQAAPAAVGGAAVAAAVAAEAARSASAEFLGGLAAALLARVQGKPAGVYTAEKWEAALGAALVYMEERDRATEEGAMNEEGDGAEEEEAEEEAEGAAEGKEGRDAWFAGLRAGAQVEVQLVGSAQWVGGTVARLYASTGRADVVLAASAKGSSSSSSSGEEEEEVPVAEEEREERGVDRFRLRSAAVAPASAPPAADDAGPKLLALDAWSRARALGRLLDETLAFPPPELFRALRAAAKDAPEALRDAPLGFDRLGRSYLYLEDHLGGVLVLRASPTKPPAPAAPPLSPEAAAAEAAAAEAAAATAAAASPSKKAKGKSEVVSGKGQTSRAKAAVGAKFAWTAKEAKKKLADEAAAAKAVARDAAAAVAKAAARQAELVAWLAAAEANGHGGGGSSGSSSSGSGGSGFGGSGPGRTEVLCFGGAGVRALCAALAASSDPRELWLWRTLSVDVLPRLAQLTAEQARLEKKAERGQRRLAKASKELERLAGRGGLGGLGDDGSRVRSARGGKVDYTFSSYDRAMKDATRE
jgi:hypothetical protein